MTLLRPTTPSSERVSSTTLPTPAPRVACTQPIQAARSSLRASWLRQREWRPLPRCGRSMLASIRQSSLTRSRTWCRLWEAFPTTTPGASVSVGSRPAADAPATARRGTAVRSASAATTACSSRLTTRSPVGHRRSTFTPPAMTGLRAPPTSARPRRKSSTPRTITSISMVMAARSRTRSSATARTAPGRTARHLSAPRARALRPMRLTARQRSIRPMVRSTRWA